MLKKFLGTDGDEQADQKRKGLDASHGFIEAVRQIHFSSPGGAHALGGYGAGLGSPSSADEIGDAVLVRELACVQSSHGIRP